MKPWIFKYQIRITALVLLALSILIANAQDSPGSLSATARDSTGAASAGAKVTTIDTEKKAAVRIVTANRVGEFPAKENFIP
ncbi:MAG: hypothetical protein J2P21_10210 [Chloracidobacterium sp.]|nr:hypothetical protein [Chloracidobacterium sp.]